MAGRKIVMDKLKDVYESLIKQDKISRDDVDYDQIIEDGSLINKLFMQCYLIFKSKLSYSEKVDAIHNLNDNNGNKIFNNRDVAEWFVSHFNDKTVKFMDSLYKDALKDFNQKDVNQKDVNQKDVKQTGGDNNFNIDPPIITDKSGMSMDENEPGMYGDMINNWMERLLGSTSSEDNKASQLIDIMDNVSETNKSILKFAGMEDLLTNTEGQDNNEVLQAISTAITMAPNLFMKFKNFAEMFIYLPHTFENVLCPYGDVICHMPIDMISWILTHMNIAAKPFLEMTPMFTDLMLASIPTLAPVLLTPPFTPIGMAAMSVAMGSGTIPAVLIKKTFDYLIQHSGDLSLFFLALGRKQYAPALTFAMEAFPMAGSILNANRTGLKEAIKWMWRLSAINRHIADGVRITDLMTRVSPITEPTNFFKDMWGNRNCIYQMPMLKDYYEEKCKQEDPQNPGESMCGRCGGVKPVVLPKNKIHKDIT